MQTAFKLGYSLAVAILFVLAVILGQRTFYEGPEAPQYPPPFELRGGPPVPVGPEGKPEPAEFLICEFDRCFKGGRELTAEDEAKLTTEERRYVQEQREFQRKWQAYEDERADYHRNVFILAQVLGIAAIAGGATIFRRVEAIPLGLLLGGIGVVIYGWSQAAVDFDEIGMAPLFVVAVVGLGVLLAVGYWFLGARRPAPGNGGSG